MPPENIPRSRPLRRPLIVSATITALFTLAALGLFLFADYANDAPNSFAVDTPLTIPAGATLREIASFLKDSGYIQSTTLFKTLAVVRGSDEDLDAGTYIFPRPLSTGELLDALSTGLYSNNTVAITIPEGTRTSLIPLLISENLSSFDAEAFEAEAAPLEGYLFPDTYYVPPDISPSELIVLLRTTFDEKMRSELGFPRESVTPDIVTLASILEREGNAEDNMRIIAGILKSRLELGMPLQVDATLEYERGRGSAELSYDDLELDSPYNTYTRRGLPPTPISNPGLTALRAALDPTPTDYLYYLTGDDGVFYYAKTFDQHKRNKDLYLSW